MYTITKATSLLKVSKVTVYKHMAKNGIEKGKKLTNEDIKVLENSISKNIKVDSTVNDIQKYVYTINTLEKEILQYEEKILSLEKIVENLSSNFKTLKYQIINL